MDLDTQKRLAAHVLGTAQSKVWFDSTRLDEIKEAITKSDIRSLVKDKAIRKRGINEHSKVRVRLAQMQKQKGRRSGPGTRKGGANSRLNRKRNWINHVRTQREFLRNLKEKKVIDTLTFRSLYLKSKGGFFRSRRHMKLYMIEHGILKNENKQQ